MRPFFFLLLLAGLAACHSSPNPVPRLLEQRDNALTNSLDSMFFHRDEMPADSFRAGLGVLRKWELHLFDDVRHCNFGQDQARANYWYRGRLKFLSPIQKEIEKLDQAPTGNK